jgi:PPOX class probable F420-dependent enzyme
VSSSWRPSHPCGCFPLGSKGEPSLVERMRSLLEAPAPAVLTTYRKDGSAHTVPVWFRWNDPAVEVVIAEGDVKLGHPARDPRCVLVVFETVRPFRGMEVRGVAELVEGDVTSARTAIAGRYLGAGDGERFAAERRSRPGVLLRLVPDSPRVWDLSGSCHPDQPWTASTRERPVWLAGCPTEGCLPWHPMFRRMHLDHPDDPSGSVYRLDRRPTQREQAGSVWSHPDRRGASDL